MAWLDELTQQRTNQAYASVFPLYEQQTPQYPFPNPYSLAQYGYRRNELIYECIHKWEIAFSQAPLKAYQEDKDTSAKPRKRKPMFEIPDHPAYKFLTNPNPYFSAETFQRAKQTYLKIAGFSAWEIEFDNAGDPLALWPMRPDWCSFKRGPNQPLAHIRYQPYGLPYKDIPIERVMLYQYFDPIFPLLKALSPSMVANRVTSVDNAITDFLQLFFQRGAVINGLLTTDQTLQDTEALRIRKLWGQQHGGIDNWTDVAVIGSGVKYQDMGKDFRSMQFDFIDAREERRICQCFHVDPILVATGDAAASSTYNNKEQAHRGWHREEIVPEWKWDAGETARQLGRYWPELIDGSVKLKYDTSDVYALQEDRSALYKDVLEATKQGVFYRDLALEKLGEDPVDNGEQVWLNVTVRAMDTGGLNQGGLEGIDTTGTAQANPFPGQAPGKPNNAQAEAAAQLERKQFKAWAAKRIKAGEPLEGFKFVFISKGEQAALMRPFSTKAKMPTIKYGSDQHRTHMERFDKQANVHEEKIRAAAKGLFERQKAAIIARLQGTKSDPDPFDIDEWIAEFEAVLTPLILDSLKDAGTRAYTDFSVSNPNVAKFLKARQQKFAVKLNKNTWQELKDSFVEGIGNGEGITQLMDRVDAIMGDKIQSSSETIARTETIGALNKGTLEGWKQGDVVKTKTWLATLDDRVREAHAEAHGQTVGIDEPFIVDGEEMDHPGDQSGSPENVIDCRCSMTGGVE